MGSPDDRTFTEIDYICINKRWKSALLGVRACRGADLGSDHYILFVMCRLRLRCLLLVQIRFRSFLTEKFKDRTTVDKFLSELRNRFRSLTDCHEIDIDGYFRKFKEVIIKRAGNIIGRRPGMYKELWIQNRM